MIRSSSLRIPENYSCDLGKEQENDPIDHIKPNLQNRQKKQPSLPGSLSFTEMPSFSSCTLPVFESLGLITPSELFSVRDCHLNFYDRLSQHHLLRSNVSYLSQLLTFILTTLVSNTWIFLAFYFTWECLYPSILSLKHTKRKKKVIVYNGEYLEYSFSPDEILIRQM